MFNIYGKYTGATVYSDICDSEATSQIYGLCNHPIFEGASVKIMPDVHSGVGCTVGTTVKMRRRAVIPSVVGSDIGCGVLSVRFSREGEIDFAALDGFINKNIPYGMTVRQTKHKNLDKRVAEAITSLSDDLKMYKSREAFLRSVGTLGGGNHYIEIGRADDGYMLSVHTGSRGIGKCVAKYFTDLADKYVVKRGYVGFDRSMPYIEGEEYDLYLTEMTRATLAAAENRRLIARDILAFLCADEIESFDTVHNYIEVERDGTLTIRKGAVSAKSGERLAIPLNMRDGIIIAEGLGNPDWNFSAPHGAGRLLSRREAKESLDIEQFKREMSGVVSFSVGRSTLDESPMAYKPADEILSVIGESVKIIGIVKPLYNFKAH
jgi:RNA-splicing ligase RtcB